MSDISLPRDRKRLSQRELEGGFLRLASGAWRSQESRPFARRVKNAPALAAPFLIQRLAEGDPREQELAAGLLQQMTGPRVVAPLQQLLRDTTLPYAARAAAGSVLQAMGESPADLPLAGPLPNPHHLLASVWETIFARAAAEESFREQFIASLEEDDAAGRRDAALSLAEPRDERALLLLLPLLHSSRVSTITAAIDAIEEIGSPRAVPGLRECAVGDPHPRVRAHARTAYGRLIMRSGPLSAGPKRPEPLTEALPLHRCWLTLLDRNGEQAVLASRRRPDGLLKVVTVLVSDVVGVKACFGVDQMRPEELVYVVGVLGRHGVTPVEVGPLECQATVSEARSLSVQLRRRLPMALEIWRETLDGPPAAEPAQLPLPAGAPREDLMALLPETGALLTTPEFRQWYFESGLVWPYVDEWYEATIQQQNGDAGKKVLDQLVEAAIGDLFDESLRRLLARRLARQAALLRRLGKDEAARLAEAASLGVDPDNGIPLTLHPFVRGMVLSSFLNAGLRPPQPRLFPMGWE